jgi:hypothetical protein
LRHWAKRCLLLRTILVVGIAAPESSLVPSKPLGPLRLWGFLDWPFLLTVTSSSSSSVLVCFKIVSKRRWVNRICTI